MSDPTCIFCKIINGIIPARRIDETSDLIVIQDIAPKAPTHWLIIPKIHIPSLAQIEEVADLVGQAILIEAAKLSKRSPELSSFRLVFNTGEQSGQSVFHLHAHFLSGNQMHDF